jgi:hypothetical protein
MGVKIKRYEEWQIEPSRTSADPFLGAQPGNGRGILARDGSIRES